MPIPTTGERPTKFSARPSGRSSTPSIPEDRRRAPRGRRTTLQPPGETAPSGRPQSSIPFTRSPRHPRRSPAGGCQRVARLSPPTGVGDAAVGQATPNLFNGGVLWYNASLPGWPGRRFVRAGNMTRPSSGTQRCPRAQTIPLQLFREFERFPTTSGDSALSSSFLFA